MSQDSFFREVDDELRRERMHALWRRFGPYVIGAAVAVVLLVAANEAWAWYRGTTSARSSDQFYSAVELSEKGDLAVAQAALDQTVQSGSGQYPLLARFKKASLLAREGKTAEAVAAYDALASGETNQRIRELALVLAANLLVDGGDVSAVQSRVGAIAVEGNPLRSGAREAIGLTQYKAGDLAAARATFEAIAADPLVGQDVARRMGIYIAQLTAEGAPAAAADTASDPSDTSSTPPVEPAGSEPPPADQPPVPVADPPAGG